MSSLLASELLLALEDAASSLERFDTTAGEVATKRVYSAWEAIRLGKTILDQGSLEKARILQRRWENAAQAMLGRLHGSMFKLGTSVRAVQAYRRDNR